MSRARHGARTEDEARRLLDVLRRDDAPPAAARALGDGFALGADVGPLTDPDVDRRFGPGFAAALATAAPHGWAGPVASTYGLHLVWVSERLPATSPSLDAVRGRVVHELLHDRKEARARERLAALRERNHTAD